MTYNSQELRERGVSEEVIAWKAWRRDMGITQLEAAAMAGLCPETIADLERGAVKPQARTRAKLQKLMQRWDESKRPARGPERRGAHLNKGSAHGAL